MIDYKTRRQLRQKLGSRGARRAGTKTPRKDGSIAELPRRALAKLIQQHLRAA